MRRIFLPIILQKLTRFCDLHHTNAAFASRLTQSCGSIIFCLCIFWYTLKRSIKKALCCLGLLQTWVVAAKSSIQNQCLFIYCRRQRLISIIVVIPCKFVEKSKLSQLLGTGSLFIPLQKNKKSGLRGKRVRKNRPLKCTQARDDKETKRWNE